MKRIGGRHPFKVSTDKQEYDPNEQVIIRAKFFNKGQVDANMRMTAKVQVSPSRAEKLELRPTGDGVTFEGYTKIENAGNYLVQVWPGNSEEQLRAKPNTHTFSVVLDNEEIDNATLDEDTLKNLAVVTDGRYFTLDKIDELPKTIKVGLISNELLHSDEVWNAPILIILFLIAIITEWIIRKRCRLV